MKKTFLWCFLAFYIMLFIGLYEVQMIYKTTITPDEIWSLIRETQENLKTVSISQKNTKQQGLFVIRATGNSFSIINKKDFQPKDFS